MTFKPFKWDCEKQGCFNKKRRLDFGMFYDALPGRISFSDIDGITEINGCALLIEAKTSKELCEAQAIMFRNMSKGGKISTLVCVFEEGTMNVTDWALMYDGEWEGGGWKKGNTQDVFIFIEKWAKWAKSQPEPYPEINPLAPV